MIINSQVLEESLYPEGFTITFFNTKHFSGFPFKLETINFLVGPNGSGKSSFLKYLKIANELFYKLTETYGAAGDELWRTEYIIHNENVGFLFSDSGNSIIIRYEGRLTPKIIEIELRKEKKPRLAPNNDILVNVGVIYLNRVNYEFDNGIQLQVILGMKKSLVMPKKTERFKPIYIGRIKKREKWSKIKGLKQPYYTNPYDPISEKLGNGVMEFLNSLSRTLQTNDPDTFELLGSGYIPIQIQDISSLWKKKSNENGESDRLKEVPFFELHELMYGDPHSVNIINAQHFEREDVVFEGGKGFNHIKRLDGSAIYKERLVELLSDFFPIKDIIIDRLRSKSYSIDIVTASRGRKELGQLPSGFQRLFWLFLELEMLYHGEDWIAISEPETSLHPAFQSRFIRAIKRFSDNQGMGDRSFIFLETHSEYIIREAQLIRKELGEDAPNPFKVYYFDEKMEPKELRMRADGRFLDEFGPGFFDEAVNQALSL